MANKKSSYEGSVADKKADKAAAKRAGTTQKAYEGSAADRRADKAAIKSNKSTSKGGKSGY